MWTDITRKRYARAELLLPSDLTDAEWAILEPLLPSRAKRGRPPVWDYRLIVEAILYLRRGGLPWRMLPPGLFPPMSMVNVWQLPTGRFEAGNDYNAGGPGPPSPSLP